MLANKKSLILILLGVLSFSTGCGAPVNQTPEDGQDIIMDAANISNTVLESAKEEVYQLFTDIKESDIDYHYSDWRIENIEFCYRYDDFDGVQLDIYRMNYEFLSNSPEEVVLAGGMTMTADGWVCPTYPNCTYLVFKNDGNELNHLLTMMENDCKPGDDLFTMDLKKLLEDIL